MRSLSEIRVLSPVEQRLVEWGLSEGQALAIAATNPTIATSATDAEIEHVVICTLVNVAEQIHGPAKLQYISGERRDTVRQQYQRRLPKKESQ